MGKKLSSLQQANKKYIYILCVIEGLKNHKHDKIIFKIYLKILKINYLNQFFMNNLLIVLLFLYYIHNN
jgi:hypothetical protein